MANEEYNVVITLGSGSKLQIMPGADGTVFHRVNLLASDGAIMVEDTIASAEAKKGFQKLAAANMIRTAELA